MIAGTTYDVLPDGLSDYLLVACPIYIVGVGVWRTFSTVDDFI